MRWESAHTEAKRKKKKKKEKSKSVQRMADVSATEIFENNCHFTLLLLISLIKITLEASDSNNVFVIFFCNQVPQ